MDKIGVVVGRFQPFHKGHAWLIDESVKRFSKIIIVIGSSNKIDKDNPWTISEREKMLKSYLQEKNLVKNVIGIYEVEDVPDDDIWRKMVIDRIPNSNFVIIGDNEWVNGIFEKAGYEVYRPGYHLREKYEGVKIRDLMRQKKKWSDRIPVSVYNSLKK